VSVDCPQRKECGSLEGKFVSIWRPTQAIQEAFDGVSAQHPLVVLTFALRERKKARGDGCRSVLALSRVSQRLHVGANDIANPADFGVTVDFVDVSLLLAKTIL
jgi:hypothetical protein